MKTPKTICILSLILLSLSLNTLLLTSQITAGNQTTSSNAGVYIAPNNLVNPFGSSPPTIPLFTTSNQATFTFYVINSRSTQATIPVYLDSSLYTTVTLPPYSYKPISLQLSTGLHTISANSETVNINVTAVQNAVNGVMYLNSTPTLITINANPGEVYSLFYSYSPQVQNLNLISQGFITNLANNYWETSYVFPSPANKLLIIVPQNISQGLYYAYYYSVFAGFVNGTEIPNSYVYGIVLINVSYGIPSSLPSPVKYVGQGGISAFVENISGNTYLQINYPFSFQNVYNVTVLTNGKEQTYILTNTSGGNYVILGTPYSLSVYGTNTQWSYSNSSIILKLPQFSSGIVKVTGPYGNAVLNLSTSSKISLVTTTLKVLSVNGSPIQGATIDVYNVTTKSLITTLQTNSTGLTTLQLPQGTQVEIYVKANGYLSNSTVFTVTQQGELTVYLKPIVVSITPSVVLVNGTQTSLVSTKTGYELTKNITVGSTIEFNFTVKVSGMVMNNISVNAYINGNMVTVKSLGNGNYSVVFKPTNTGTYNLTLVANYNGVSNRTTIEFYTYQLPVTTGTSTTTSTTSTTSSTTTSSPTTTTSTSTITTSQSGSTTPSTSSGFPLIPVIIVVIIVIVIVAVVLLIMRR
ncbi:hypothetical protein SUSAZ_11095 [Sulfolobus acidocaldarius SUSAZ]|nr:hypothetical protein SUSAZ_11095 [Sulfolobus acidocaldarius SUSAZ]